MTHIKTLAFTLTLIICSTINQSTIALNPFSDGTQTSNIQACSVKTSIAALILFLTKTKIKKPDNSIQNIEHTLKIMENCKH